MTRVTKYGEIRMNGYGSYSYSHRPEPSVDTSAKPSGRTEPRFGCLSAATQYAERTDEYCTTKASSKILQNVSAQRRRFGNIRGFSRGRRRLQAWGATHWTS